MKRKALAIARCSWCTSDPLYMEYHDHEWGIPVHDDRHLFEMLILEGAQAGLSWLTVLKKRKNYRKAFAQFNAKKISRFDDNKVEQLMKNEGIIRNRLKIQATVINAKAFLKVQKEFGTFDQYIWQFAPPPKGHFVVPTRTSESDAMSLDLKKRGFKFIGTTICYAYMQAIGMVNDHAQDCFTTVDHSKAVSKRSSLAGL